MSKEKTVNKRFFKAKSTECEQTEASDADEGMRHTNGRQKEETKLNIKTKSHAIARLHIISSTFSNAH